MKIKASIHIFFDRIKCCRLHLFLFILLVDCAFAEGSGSSPAKWMKGFFGSQHSRSGGIRNNLITGSVGPQESRETRTSPCSNAAANCPPNN